jgi:ADP-ribosylarginine hydrolase
MSQDQIQIKFKECMIAHALGDTIGYKNGSWEFMFSLDKAYEFISLGGVNHISFKDWIVSDDTILHISLAKALVSNYNSINTLCEIFSSYLVQAYDEFSKEGFNKRAPGNITLNAIKAIKNGGRWNELKYNINQGGSGASMRTACIGLAYHKEEDLDTLIQVAIETSRITHNSAVGYLGGLVTALFTSYAIRGIDIMEWCHRLIELYETKRIHNYIQAAKRDIKEFEADSMIFFEKWKTYIKDKFKDGKIIERKSSMNLYLRGKYYQEKFGYISSTSSDKHRNFPGSGGDDSVIISYDCLLDARNNWEKLIFYAMLHIGDTDTTGCIAGAWYGAYYGLSDIPESHIRYLEYKFVLEDLGSQLYNKFK